MERKQKNLKAILKLRLLRKLGLFLVVLVGSVGVGAYYLRPNVDDESEQKLQEKIIRPVSVLRVSPKTHRSVIIAYGEVRPEWEVAVRSKVEGDVVDMSERLRVGRRVNKGEFLLQINKVASEAQVADAELQLNRARVGLLVEEKESKEAFDSWEQADLGAVTPSTLVLREPYLELAHSNVVAANNALLHAKQQLDFTTVRAPFDALIVSRDVSLGGDVFAGDVLCRIVGTEKSEIALHIDKRQWKQLPKDWSSSSVRIVDPDLEYTWNGHLVRDGSHYSQNSRLRTVFVEVINPLDQEQALLPGNFVEVQVEGKSVDHLLRIPESARNQKGVVWFVENGDLLKSYSVIPEFQRDGFLFVKSPFFGEVSVVVNPNNSFVDGLKVTPVEKGF